MLLVIQIQDADIDARNNARYGDSVAGFPANGQTALNSAGFFEYVWAQGAPDGSGNITITGAGTGSGLLHDYRTDTTNISRRDTRHAFTGPTMII
jgi:hypothetical protein